MEQLRRSPPYLEYLRTICSIEFDKKVKAPRSLAIRYLLVGQRTTRLIEKHRVSDPQALPDEAHDGITVGRVVGNRIHFDRLRKLVA